MEKKIYKCLAIFLSKTIDKGENKHTDSQAVKNIIRTEKKHLSKSEKEIEKCKKRKRKKKLTYTRKNFA